MARAKLILFTVVGLGCTGLVTGPGGLLALDSGTPAHSIDSGAPGDSADSGDSGTETPSGDAGSVPRDDAGIVPPQGRDYGTDSSKFFGQSRCADAGLQLCDGFETGTLDTAVWNVSGNKPVFDSTHVARGAMALRIRGKVNQQAFLHETRTFPARNDTYYGRLFAYLDALPSPPAQTYAHWTMVAATGTGVEGQIRVGGQLQARFGKKPLNFFGVGTDARKTDAGTGDWTTADNDPAGMPTPLPLHTWMCLEWMHDGQHDTTSFWWDAVHHPSLDTTASHHGGRDRPYVMPEFTDLSLGWTEYQPDDGGTLDMWIDEVAVDPQRIGCVL